MWGGSGEVGRETIDSYDDVIQVPSCTCSDAGTTLNSLVKVQSLCTGPGTVAALVTSQCALCAGLDAQLIRNKDVHACRWFTSSTVPQGAGTMRKATSSSAERRAWPARARVSSCTPPPRRFVPSAAPRADVSFPRPWARCPRQL